MNLGRVVTHNFGFLRQFLAIIGCFLFVPNSLLSFFIQFNCSVLFVNPRVRLLVGWLVGPSFGGSVGLSSFPEKAGKLQRMSEVAG